MREVPEEDYLLLSGIQHFSFCKRQWALIHVEGLWSENWRTVEGALLHNRAHDGELTEKRRDLLIARSLAVRSTRMGVSGQCDVVEFYRNDVEGVPLSGRKGKWRPSPVEYKRGKPKTLDADRLQLCAQAICLEEMLGYQRIQEAFLFYGETKHRETVALTDSLRQQTEELFAEMHRLMAKRITPPAQPSKSCNACSLQNDCLPWATAKHPSVAMFVQTYVTTSPE